MGISEDLSPLKSKFAIISYRRRQDVTNYIDLKWSTHGRIWSVIPNRLIEYVSTRYRFGFSDEICIQNRIVCTQKSRVFKLKILSEKFLAVLDIYDDLI